MREILQTIIPYFFLPFILFPLWGPFASFALAVFVVKRERSRAGGNDQPRGHPGLKAFLAQLFVFTPAIVGSQGGMALMFPWWLGYLAIALEPLSENSGARIRGVYVLDTFAMFVPLAAVLAMLATWKVNRRLRRESESRKP